MSKELEARLRNVARGRAVFVKFEPQDFLFAVDYRVVFRDEANAFDVTLRRGGCFEGAYRCIERWIESKAEELDGIDSVPPDYVDFRTESSYRLFEKFYEQFRSDFESAITERVAWLERTRPGEGDFGEVVVEERMRLLLGLLAHLQRTDNEVRRGVLSPETIQLLKDIGLDVPTPHAG